MGGLVLCKRDQVEMRGNNVRCRVNGVCGEG